MFSGACGARAASGGDVERHAAGEHRGERLRVDAQAARVQRQVDAARVPEAACSGHELLVRRLDEDLHRQLVAVGVERVADDAADRRAAMEHRRADVERAEVARRAARRSRPARRAARKAAPRGRRTRCATRSRRRRRCRCRRPRAACRGRSRRPCRCAAARPRTSVSSTAKRRRRAIELDDDDDALPVVAQADRDDLADHDLLVANLGLSGLDAVGRLELDLDRAGR